LRKEAQEEACGGKGRKTAPESQSREEALKEAKQAAARANEPLRNNPDATLNGHSNGAKLNGKRLNGKQLNGHLSGDGGQISTRKTMSVRPGIFARARGNPKDKQEGKQARDGRALA
jgi:hypothetical protein